MDQIPAACSKVKEKLGNEIIIVLLETLKLTITSCSIQIDYSALSDHLKDLEEKDEIKKMADKLLHSIKTLQDTLTKIQAPNMRVCPIKFSPNHIFYS